MQGKAAEISYQISYHALEHDVKSQDALGGLSQQFMYCKSLRMKKPTWKVTTTPFPEPNESEKQGSTDERVYVL